jgi:O-antigen/teichoic acid export membrane protein
MLVGFALAQALPLLASPLLARLFSPEAFGLQALFLSVSSVVLVLATLRLDLAEVLAASRREALDILSLGGLQTLGIALLTVVTAALLAPQLANMTGHEGSHAWVWAIAPMIVALSAVQLASGLLTWLKRFGPVSQAQVANQVSYLAIALGLGLWASPVEGLVFARLGGQLVAAIGLTWLLRSFMSELRFPPRADRPGLWARCKPFLVFNTPYSLVGVIGREVPVFAFSAVAASAAAGFYGLARTLLWAPASLLAASLSQVFYREAAEHRGTPRLEALVFRMLLATTGATAPVFAVLAIWGDVGFSLVFGKQWVAAGHYAMVLALPSWLAIQTAWPERLFESVGRQGVSFAIQVTFDVMSAVIVFSSVLTGQPYLATVALFAGINTAFHLAYLTGMVSVSGLPMRSLVHALATGGLIFAGTAAACWAIRLAAGAELGGLLLATSLALLAAATLARRGYRSIAEVGAA